MDPRTEFEAAICALCGVQRHPSDPRITWWHGDARWECASEEECLDRREAGNGGTVDAPPASIPLATDKLVATRMMNLRSRMNAERGRQVQWWEVLQYLLNVNDAATRGRS